MQLSTKACALTTGALWGGAVLASGLINLSSPSYGNDFLKVIRSVYPGFRYKRTVADVLVGTAYGFLDGAACGVLYAALYNRFSGADGASRAARQRAEMEPVSP